MKLAAVEASLGAGPGPSRTTMAHSKLRVLVADDDPRTLEAISTVLASLDQEILRAHSGSEALRCILDQDLDLILIDVFMPDLDGFEIAKLVRGRDRCRNLPIVFMTAADKKSSLVLRAREVNALDVLFKPIDPDALLTKITLYLNQAGREELIAEQSRRLATQATLLNLAPDCVVVRSLDDTILLWNRGAEEMLGWSASAMVGRNWREALRVTLPLGVEEIRKTLEATGRWEGEFSYLHRDGREVEVASRWALKRDPLGQPEAVLEISREVTERNRILRELEERRLQLEAANERLTEVDRYKDEFLSVISHELRTPLNFIFGYTSILEDEVVGPLNEKQADMVRKISEGADRMLGLVNDLLDLARIQAGKLHVDLRPLQLQEIVFKAVDAAQASAQAAGVSISVEAQDLVVRGDEARLMQIMGNLLSNAIKFTPKGGAIRVTLERREQEAVVRVEDTGIGIAAADLPKLFNRFQQLDMGPTRAAGGVGLGLAITKALVEAQAGRIGVESQPGKGSTFYFALPLETEISA